MLSGVVKAWMDGRGFGFITDEDGKDVFVHAKSLPKGVTQLHEGDKVLFETKRTDRGMQAINVVLGLAVDADADDRQDPHVIPESQFLREMKDLLPNLRETYKQALLDNAREHGWVTP